MYKRKGEKYFALQIGKIPRQQPSVADENSRNFSLFNKPI